MNSQTFLTQLAGWVSVITTLVIGFSQIYKFIKQLNKTMTDINAHLAEARDTREGLLSGLRYDLTFCANTVLRRGRMTPYENEFLISGYTSYAALGGIGRTKLLVEQALEVKPIDEGEYERMEYEKEFREGI